MSSKTVMVDNITLSFKGTHISYTDNNIRRIINEDRHVITNRRSSYPRAKYLPHIQNSRKSITVSHPSLVNIRRSPNLSPCMGPKVISNGTPKRLIMRRNSVYMPPFTL